MKITIIITTYIVFLFVSKCLEVKRLKEEIKRMERSRDRWERHYEEIIKSIQRRYDELLEMKIGYSKSIYPGIVQAVKHAMRKD